MITNIDNLETLNSITYQRFSSEHNTKSTEFNCLAAHVINTGDYSRFRSYLADGSSLSDYSDLISEDTSLTALCTSSSIISTLELYAPSSEGIDYFFFPFSKKEFISTFFSDLLPSISESIFNLLKSSGRITQIGAGSGKAFVIKSQEFTESHLEMISTTNSPEEILSQISLSISHLSNSLVDNSYLLNQLDLKDLKIKELNQQIDDLNKKIYSVYQTTWR
jgi:hypothetical protein